MSDTARPLIPISEAASLLGVSTETVRKRATRTGTVAPGVPILQGNAHGRRFVHAATLHAVLAGEGATA